MPNEYVFSRGFLIHKKAASSRILISISQFIYSFISGKPSLSTLLLASVTLEKAKCIGQLGNVFESDVSVDFQILTTF